MDRRNAMPSAQDRAPKPKNHPLACINVNPTVEKFKKEAIIRETMKVVISGQDMQKIVEQYVLSMYPDFRVHQFDVICSGHEIVNEIEITLVTEREEINGLKK